MGEEWKGWSESLQLVCRKTSNVQCIVRTIGDCSKLLYISGN